MELDLHLIFNKIVTLTRFKPEYKLILKTITPQDLSFDKFRGKSVLEWCYLCENRLKCGYCPNEHNRNNENSASKIMGYQHGLVILITVPSAEIAGPIAWNNNGPANTQILIDDCLLEAKKIIRKSGNHDILTCGAGPCNLTYCFGKKCSIFDTGKCRHPNQSNPCIECFGLVNVFNTLNKLGETIHYIDRNTNPSDVPYGCRVGMVFY